MTETEPSAQRNAKASFCVPKAAIKALIDAKADVVMIGAYLTLACYTEATGQFSSASVTAMSKVMSLNKDRARKAMERLAAIQVKVGKHQHSALVYSRDAWIKAKGAPLPDGPVERAKILHVLPDFGEELGDRVWFSRNLVEGIGSFRQPLKRIKDAGDAAGRLFLLMQQAVDVAGWLAIPPNAGPWVHYETVLDQNVGSARVIHGKHAGPVMWTQWIEAYGFDAVKALIGSGLFYEVVMVLNRNPKPRKFSSGEEYGGVPPDAEPLYELDTRSIHGYKPQGEEGLAGLTAKTVGEIGHSVAAGQIETESGEHWHADGLAPGAFMGKYAAIVPAGYGTMIVGVYRPRFRVTNPKNAGVKDAWLRIYENQRIGLALIEQLRVAMGLKPLTATEKPPVKDEPEPPSKALH